MPSLHEQTRRDVLSTIAYFDGNDYPLTRQEVFSLLFGNPASWSEVMAAIGESINLGIIEDHGAFLSLPNRGSIVETRISRWMLAEDKFKRTMKSIAVMRFIPWIRMVAVCNTLAFDMTRPEGDLDVFIVCARNRLYFTRLMVTGLLHLLRLRRHHLRIRNRICLSFYVDEDGMDISRFQLPDGDPYLAVWTQHIIPVFAIHGTFDLFWKTNEPWLKKHFAHPRAYQPDESRVVQDHWLSRVFRRTLELTLTPLSWLFETVARSVELSRIKRTSQRFVRSVPFGVVVDRHTLKFHEEDRRVWYRSEMQKKIRLLLEAKV